MLVKALQEEVGLPIHLHTHDTSGISGATVLAAVDAGVDAVDAAMDAMSGTTSQPCLGSLVEALAPYRARHRARSRGDPPDQLLLGERARAIRRLRERSAITARRRSICTKCRAASSPISRSRRARSGSRRAGTRSRETYRAVNDMFGDIVKVTPSSKVVGDMALMMVSQNLTPRRCRLDPDREIAFPASVVEMLHGDLGQPPGGWPAALQKKVLKGEPPITVRPGLAAEGRSIFAAERREGREGLRAADRRCRNSPPT